MSETTSSPATETSALSMMPAALDRFGRLVHAVAPDRWQVPTPDDDWTVRDLVAHVVTEHRWAPYLLAGGTIEQAGDRFDGDPLGTDPAGAWDRAAQASLPAWRHAGADDVVHLSMGPTPAWEYAEQMLLDLTVHGWDLARGAGLPDRMDDRAARHVLDFAGSQVHRWRSAGIFAPAVDVATDDPGERLLGLLGRRPGWTAPGH